MKRRRANGGYATEQVLAFHDSLPLLPGTLAKIALRLPGENKCCFPHAFVTPNNLCYAGTQPSSEYYAGERVPLRIGKE